MTFNTTNVTLWFIGNIKYYASGWKDFDGPSMELLPGNYTFSFGDSSHPSLQTTITVSDTSIEKTIAYVRVLTSNGQGQSGVTPTTWWDYGGSITTISTPTNSDGALLIVMDGKHTNTAVQIFWYGAGSRYSFPNPATVDSFYDCQLYKATVQLLDNTGAVITSATPDIYFHAYGVTPDTLIGPMSGGQINIDLLPGAKYLFDIKNYSFNGSQGGISGKLNTNPQTFKFQTGKVIDGDYNCTQYHQYGGPTTTYVNGVQLLPSSIGKPFYFDPGEKALQVKAGQTLNINTGIYTTP